MFFRGGLIVKWDKSEIINQIFHAIIGFFVALISIVFICLVYGVYIPAIGNWTVFMVSISIEICQYLYNDKKLLYITERIRDIIFYQTFIFVFWIYR